MKKRSDYFHTTDGKSIYFEEIIFGQSDRHLVLLNGLTQTTVIWEPILNKLRWDGKVILCDFIFQGKSDKSGPSRDFDLQARDIYELLSYLSAKNISIAGISYGSLVAQHYAVNYPGSLEKLILISSFAHKTPIYRAIELSWKQALLIGDFGLMLDVMLPYVLSNNYFSSPLIPIDSLKKLRKEMQPQKDALLKLMEATENRKDYLDKLKKLHCQTMIVQGEKDLLFPPSYAEEIRKAVSGSVLKIIPGKGHTLNLEAVEELTEAMESFLNIVK
ncbi:MAG: hypothetical protein RLZZ46_1279 [Bacteroidota bacterium]|jgi:3-oxoadipate enol-lactonase